MYDALSTHGASIVVDDALSQYTVQSVEVPDGGTVPEPATYPLYVQSLSSSRSLDALPEGLLESRNQPADREPLPSQSCHPRMHVIKRCCGEGTRHAHLNSPNRSKDNSCCSSLGKIAGRPRLLLLG